MSVSPRRTTPIALALALTAAAMASERVATPAFDAALAAAAARRAPLLVELTADW